MLPGKNNGFSILFFKWRCEWTMFFLKSSLSLDLLICKMVYCDISARVFKKSNEANHFQGRSSYSVKAHYINECPLQYFYENCLFEEHLFLAELLCREIISKYHWRIHYIAPYPQLILSKHYNVIYVSRNFAFLTSFCS